MIDDVLGKSVMVAFIIAMTTYNRIAGIVALILVIALLNRNPTKEGLTLGKTATSPAPISFNSPDEFRQKYCLKGVADDPTQSGQLGFSYMLTPSFFTLDASGNPTLTKEEIDAVGKMDPSSFMKCKPLILKSGQDYETINNMCDPACPWTMKPASTAAPTTAPTTEGFTPMLRPHIRAGRHLVTDGAANVKSVVNRLNRQLF